MDEKDTSNINETAEAIAQEMYQYILAQMTVKGLDRGTMTAAVIKVMFNLMIDIGLSLHECQKVFDFMKVALVDYYEQ